MKISTSYPYPVLHEENDDYINSKFESTIITKNSFGELKLDISFELTNMTIYDLIKNGDAVFMVHIECSKTSYRDIFTTDEPYISISISTDVLSGKVEVNTFIVANSNISDYRNNDLNKWYEGVSISYEKGNFLAIGNAIEITLNEDNIELLNLPSIVKIRRLEKKEYMEVDFMQDNITIGLPAYEYDQYANNAGHMLKHTIISTVILPSLVQVFSIINSVEDISDFVWFQVLENIFKENNYNIRDVGTDNLPALKATQMVLKKPILESFKEIERLNTMGD